MAPGAKSVGWPEKPVTANGGSAYTDSIVNDAVPVLLTVTVCAALVLPTDSFANDSDVLLKLAAA